MRPHRGQWLTPSLDIRTAKLPVSPHNRDKNMAELEGTSFAVAPPGVVGDNISTGSIPLTMPEITDSTPVRVNASAGHLSVHVEGAHPVDIPFLFEQPQKRIGGA